MDATFALAFLAVSTGSAWLFSIAGICTFAFCAVFAYILADGVGQDLGGQAMPMGNAIIKCAPPREAGRFVSGHDAATRSSANCAGCPGCEPAILPLATV